MANEQRQNLCLPVRVDLCDVLCPNTYGSTAMKNTKWRPAIGDLMWTIKILALVRDGGVWKCPDGRSEWKVFKRKRLIRVDGEDNELNRRIKKVLLMLGFSVLEIETKKGSKK